MSNLAGKNVVLIIIIIISFISVDPYRIRNPYEYGKWSHNHRVYKTIKTIFVSLAAYKLFEHTKIITVLD